MWRKLSLVASHPRAALLEEIRTRRVPVEALDCLSVTESRRDIHQVTRLWRRDFAVSGALRRPDARSGASALRLPNAPPLAPTQPVPLPRALALGRAGLRFRLCGRWHPDRGLRADAEGCAVPGDPARLDGIRGGGDDPSLRRRQRTATGSTSTGASTTSIPKTRTGGTAADSAMLPPDGRQHGERRGELNPLSGDDRMRASHLRATLERTFRGSACAPALCPLSYAVFNR